MADAEKYIANAMTIMFAMLVTELDKRGGIDKGEFIDILRRSADDAEDGAPHRTSSRLDTKLFRITADLVEGHRPSGSPETAKTEKWVPELIEGGKDAED